MSCYIEAIKVLRSHPVSARLLPDNLINYDTETIRFDRINYGVLSGGEKTLLSWMYCLWTGESPPEKWRDPLEGFGGLDQTFQVLILKAISLRHEMNIDIIKCRGSSG